MSTNTRTPVELTLYDEKNEIVKELSRVVVPWGILKKATRLSEDLDVDALKESDIDNIAGLVVEIFGEQNVSIAELDKYADVGDMIMVVMSIMNRASALAPNSPAPKMPRQNHKKKA